MTRHKILVVEDDDDLRLGLTLRLKASGYDVVHATDGIAAISMARRESPDLVLLDLGLPGGDGISVLERYANLPALCGIPVVVLTGRDPLTAGPAVARYAVSAFLQKPADNDELLRAIGDALGTELLEVPAREPVAAPPMPGATPSSWFG